MITIERLKQIAISGHWDNATTQADIRDIAQYLVEQAEKQEAMKPRPRVERGGCFWYVTSRLSVDFTTEAYVEFDDARYNSGNYFLTKQEAQAFADKIKELRKTM